MKVVAWNVNGIRSAINKGLLDLVNSKKYDVIMLQEVESDSVPLGFDESYTAYLNASSRKKGYSGTLTLTRLKPLSVSYGIGDSRFDGEGRVISAEFEKLYVINAYFPNSQHGLTRLDYKLEFNAAFERFLQGLKKPVVVGGDFNVAHEEIDIARPKDNVNNAGFTKQERDWMTHFLSIGYLDTFRLFVKDGGHYTWWSYRFNARERNIGWRIDYIIVSSVEGFREKPDEETAEKYVNEGYLWNMGMFYMKRDTGVNASRELLPEVYRIVFEDECRGYEDLKETSFDKGIVERYRELSVVKYSGEWRDIGSWKSFYEVQKKDSMGNVALGNSLAVSSENSLTVSQDKLTVAYGVKGLAVIATRDATLVIPLELSEKVKDIVNMLGERVEARRSPTMYRPWGYYTILEEGPRYKVKKLFVAPGKSLSYQMHYHRAEHWVVVKGTAKVTYDDKENIVAENESFYVPMGKRHRIENPGKLPLEIIEVQTGEYLEEDDIVRL